MKTEKGKFYGNASNKLCRKREGKEGKAGSRQNMKQRKGRKEINNTWDVWRGEGIIDTKGMDNGGKNDSPRFSRESKSKSKLKSRNRWMEEWERGLARSADLASSWETGTEDWPVYQQKGERNFEIALNRPRLGSSHTLASAAFCLLPDCRQKMADQTQTNYKLRCKHKCLSRIAER
ncbi:hypothetical protein WR25_15035 [Diploscapter pachys]|uniref:Uncharacterized protein n=1 Tax=Diploscapter pachys TaxID=2018661 RepID=A0A2A2LK88_9BILA|nr:hypothetical protein WR25_15035 [Diploscapter pachys]